MRAKIILVGAEFRYVKGGNWQRRDTLDLTLTFAKFEVRDVGKDQCGATPSAATTFPLSRGKGDKLVLTAWDQRSPAATPKRYLAKDSLAAQVLRWLEI